MVAAFQDLGFEPVVGPLIDGAATRDALHRLPSDLRSALDTVDSLIVFFAGHGHTQTQHYPDGQAVRTGFLIPADGDRSDGRTDSWQRLDHWLSTLAELPARHLLVILDSCHSGAALDRQVIFRGHGIQVDAPPSSRWQRRSRRVITSADADQLAWDGGGPIDGHSLFTGFLVGALRNIVTAPLGNTLVTASEIGEYLRSQVDRHSGEQQTPRVGVLEFDDGGDLALSSSSLRAASSISSSQRDDGQRRPQPPVLSRQPAQRPDRPNSEALLVDRSEGWILDPAFAAQLDRHGAERKHGGHVLSVIAGEALAAVTSWASWAARHGYLTLATPERDLDAAIADLLAQTPWLRCLPEARRRLAQAARIDVAAVDAALDARSPAERQRWLHAVAPLDRHAQVSGWLLSALRDARAQVSDLTHAPVGSGELLAIACDLASPTAVLLHHPAPDAGWLARAIAMAAALMSYLPAHSVAVTAPDELVAQVLQGARASSALTLARQGLIRITAPAERAPGRARYHTARVLFDALARDPRTRGAFELDGRIVASEGPAIEVGMVAHKARIAIELDAWYHVHDPEGYRRDRIQDLRLARAGYFVLRFPAEDVDDRLASTIDQIATALAGRRRASTVAS